MKQDITVEFDTLEFDKALVEYAAASGKDIAEATNHQLKNWCLQSAKIAKKASVGSIRGKQRKKDLVWWHAWILIRKAGGTKALQRKAAWEIAHKKLGARARAVGFIRAFLFTLANAGGGYKAFDGMKGVKVKTATPSDKTAELEASYGYKKRAGRTARKAEGIMKGILDKGMAATIRDIEKYLARKLSRG
jgi:hypothetical protein